MVKSSIHLRKMSQN